MDAILAAGLILQAVLVDPSTPKDVGDKVHDALNDLAAALMRLELCSAG